MEQQSVWSKYKVLITGLIAAVAIAIQPLVVETAEHVKWPVLGVAAGMTALSFLANNLRGQGATILGIIGITADVSYNLLEKGQFSWEKAGLMALIAYAFAHIGPPKTVGYEKTATIESAKEEGKAITKANNSN